MKQRIHLISIGGAVMHNMALCLQALGHEVTGSDDEIFEPSRSRLARAGLLPDAYGWFPEKLDAGIDAVILGMHARSDNPEIKRAQELGIKVYSFPEFVYEQSKNKTRVVIAGSHGKTTTTAMLMHVLRDRGFDFDYLVGSQLNGFDTMVRLSEAPLIIIEGDEYLNSALDPRPKFLFYHAHLAQITGVAWDHINVFPTWETYVDQFRQFLHTLPDGAPVSWYSGDATLAMLMQEAKRLESLPYTTLENEIIDGVTTVLHGGEKFPMQVFGSHNLQNMAGAMRLARELSISESDFLRSMQKFPGTSRRLEKIHDAKGITVFRDFAHSPSKLRATVDSVSLQYPEKRCVAVFELHTFSSLQKNFLEHYGGTLDHATEAIVFYSPRVLEHKKLPYIEPEEVSEAFGGEVKVYTDSDMLAEYLKATLQPGTVLLLMSSGTFEGMSLEGIVG